MNKNESSSQFILLEDRPAAADAFGSHDKVAGAIVSFIKRCRAGMTIGLEGTWGSGKSTIVRSVERSFSDDDNTKVVIFDAWSHEGDPLRRSFLEEIIAQLVDYRWLAEDRWERIRATLRGTSSESTRTTVSEATSAGRILAFVTALVPIGLFLKTLPDPPESINRLVLLLLSGPALVLLLVGLLNLVRRRIFSLPHIGILASESTFRETSSTSSEPDPSSIEFQEYFEKLLEESLASHQSRKLVLVIDNTDRVEPESAKKIWATLRVYVDRPPLDPKSPFNRLWTIVPYDRRGLTSITNSASPDPADHESSDAFMGKVFQTKFYVPPPVLFDWHNYFVEQAAAAWNVIVKEDHGQFHYMYRIYALSITSSGNRVTPRDILRFINEVGSLASQWVTEEIELRHFAYYVTLKRTEVLIQKGLVAGELPEVEYVPLLGQNVVEQLAAIHYNVGPEKATAFLLRDPIAKCLDEGNESELAKILSSHSSAELLLDEVIRDHVRLRLPEETDKFFSAVNVVFSLFGQFSSERTSEVARHLTSAVHEINVLTAFSGATSLGLIKLLKRTPSLAEKLYDIVSQSINAKAGGQNVFQWPDAVGPLLNFLKQLDQQSDEAKEQSPLEIDVSIEAWLSTATNLRRMDREGEFWHRIQPNVAANEQFYSDFQKIFEQDTLVSGVFDAICVAHKTGAPAQFQDIQNLINGKLATPTAIDTKMIAEFVAIYSFLAEAGFNPNQPMQWAKSGMALHYFHTCMADKAFKSASRCMYVYLDAFPSRTGHTKQHNSPQGGQALNLVFANPDDHEPLIREFLDIIQDSKRLDLLYKVLSSSEGTADFFAYCLAALDSPETLLDQDSFVEIWSQLQESMQNEKLPKDVYEKIVAHQLSESSLVDRMLSDGLDPDDSTLFLDALRVESKSAAYLLAALTESLDLFDADTFKSALQAHRPFVELLIALVDRNSDLKFNNRFSDAMLGIAVDAIAGQSQGFIEQADVAKLLGRLDDSTRETLRDEIRNKAKNSADSIHSEFFDIFGPEIADSSSLKRDDDLLLKLLIPIVRNGNDAGLRWMTDIPELKAIVDAATHQSHKETLFERIRDEAKEAIDDDAPIRSLAIKLGIDAKPDDANTDK